MAFAPTSTNFAPHGDGSARGSFRLANSQVHFDFSTATEDEQVFGPEFNMKVWVEDGNSFRLAKVLKTVAHVVVDEDEFGQPVVEKWQTRCNRHFTDPNN